MYPTTLMSAPKGSTPARLQSQRKSPECGSCRLWHERHIDARRAVSEQALSANYGHTADRTAFSKAAVEPDCTVPTHSLHERSEPTDAVGVADSDSREDITAHGRPVCPITGAISLRFERDRAAAMRT